MCVKEMREKKKKKKCLPIFLHTIKIPEILHLYLWWSYPAGQLHSTSTTISLHLLKGKGGENTMERVEIRTRRSLNNYCHEQNRHSIG